MPARTSKLWRAQSGLHVALSRRMLSRCMFLLLRLCGTIRPRVLRFWSLLSRFEGIRLVDRDWTIVLVPSGADNKRSCTARTLSTWLHTSQGSGIPNLFKNVLKNYDWPLRCAWPWPSFSSSSFASSPLPEAVAISISPNTFGWGRVKISPLR